MISIENLVSQEQIPGNLFAPNIYVQGDMELGTLKSRQGARLIALPNTLLRALPKGMELELGPAAKSVLRQCGYVWGKQIYQRFVSEINEYYGKPLADMGMPEFVQCLRQCWQTYGWGLIDLDFSCDQQGFLVITIQNSAFAKAYPTSDQPSCALEAGLLSTFFSQITGQELYAVQTTCESMQAECNRFILGLPERVKPAEEWVAESEDHDTILHRLCQK